jgi:glycosyltransferase involved in cell wall biosynthesis
VLLPPFLDPAPFQAAARLREAHRARLSAQHHIDASVPWIVVAAMMRPGDKHASYRMLAEVLRKIGDLPWQLVVAGDGTARDVVEASLKRAAPGRARFLGECAAGDLAAVYAACDLCVWPAVNEAYGMAMLEAQAAGIPVVSRAVRGVPDVVRDGETGLLAPGGDEDALAGLTRALLVDAPRRAEMGRAAARFVAGERSIDAAAAKLDRLLGGIAAATALRPAARLP